MTTSLIATGARRGALPDGLGRHLGGLESALPIVYKDGLHALTANGILGDPRGLNAELGRRGLESGQEFG